MLQLIFLPLPEVSSFIYCVFSVSACHNYTIQTTLQDFAFNQLIQNCVAASESIFSPYDPVDISAPGVTTPDQFSVGDLQTRYVLQPFAIEITNFGA